MNDDEPYFEVFCVWRQKVLLVLLEQLLKISLHYDLHLLYDLWIGVISVLSMSLIDLTIGISLKVI